MLRMLRLVALIPLIIRIQTEVIGRMVKRVNEHHRNVHCPSIQQRMNEIHRRHMFIVINIETTWTPGQKIWVQHMDHRLEYHPEHHQRWATKMAVTLEVIFMLPRPHTEYLQNIGKIVCFSVFLAKTISFF